MKPALTTSAIPATSSWRGNVVSSGQVDDHGGGLMEGADQVLAGVGVDAGLAADGGVHHGQQRGRHVHDVDAAQPGGRDEAGDVGGRPPAEADDGILAADADTPQHLPDEPDDRQVLAGFGVGQFDAVRVDTLVRQCFPDVFSGLGQRGLVQDRHFVPGAEEIAELGPAVRCR